MDRIFHANLFFSSSSSFFGTFFVLRFMNFVEMDTTNFGIPFSQWQHHFLFRRDFIFVFIFVDADVRVQYAAVLSWKGSVWLSWTRKTQFLHAIYGDDGYAVTMMKEGDRKHTYLCIHYINIMYKKFIVLESLESPVHVLLHDTPVFVDL